MSTLHIRDAVEAAIAAHSANSERTQQATQGFIGASDVGWCRNRLRHLIIQTPPRDPDPLRWSAFVGTAVGDRLETAWAADDPDVQAQVDIVTELPSGARIPGHADIVNPTGDYVVDFKTRDGIALYEDGELDRSNEYQAIIYRLGLVQAGILTEDSKAYLVYVDRSGRDAHPVVREVDCSPERVQEIDDWLGDAIYAVKHLEEAPRDRPYNQCEVVCPFFYVCRGADEHQDGGLIDDPVLVGAVDGYTRGAALEKQGARLKEDAKALLDGVAGSTGQHVVSWSNVGASDVSYTRKSYRRLTIRPVKKEGA